MLINLQSRYDRSRGLAYLLRWDTDNQTLIKVYQTSKYKPYTIVDTNNIYPIPLRTRKVRRYDVVIDEMRELYKVEYRTPDMIPKVMSEDDFRVWENNIKYHENFVYDTNNIMGIDGNVKRDRLEFDWTKILEQPIPSIPYCAIDIEVDNKDGEFPDPTLHKYPISSIAIYSKDRQVVLYDMEEEKIIRKAYEEMLKYPIILTFNGDNFDIPYIQGRSRQLGIPSPIMVQADKAVFRDNIHIDLHRLFKISVIHTYVYGRAYNEYSLDAISKALLGEGKSDVKEVGLASYNLNDARLTYLLFDSNLYYLMFTLMRIANLGMEEITRLPVSEWVRSLLISYHRYRNYLVPSREDFEWKGGVESEAMVKGKRYKGAIVLKPTVGIHDRVTVLDFASLYPTIIQKYNISYETVRCNHKECEKNRKVEEVSHWVCRKRQGILSKIIGDLRDARVNKFKRLGKEDRRFKMVEQAIKVILNASYGVMGTESFQLYTPPAAEMVTAIERHIIIDCINYASKFAKIVYGDTDSMFLSQISQENMQKIIEYSMEKHGVELEVDKVFKWIAFSERKKNYIGRKEDGKLDIKGISAIKYSTPPYIRKVFDRIIHILEGCDSSKDIEARKQDIVKVIKDGREALRLLQVDMGDLVVMQRLTKRPEEYNGSPQHVVVAKKIGQIDGIVKYVKCRQEPLPPEEATLGKVDVMTYLSLYDSAFDQLLEALQIDMKGQASITSFL